MALFPFLIVITSLAGFFGSKELADRAAEMMLEAWPAQVASALSGEIHNVLTQSHGGVLTLGVALALYFASNGVESFRVGLNRAYGVTEERSWYWLRLESIGYTIVAAVVSLAMAFLIVLGPLILATARRYIPLRIEPNENLFNVLRYGLTIITLIAALVILHKWLPRRPAARCARSCRASSSRWAPRWSPASCSANISSASPATMSPPMPGSRR